MEATTAETINALVANLRPHEPAANRVITVSGKTFALERDGDDDHDGDTFRELTPEKDPAAAALTASTLSAVLDYLAENHDKLPLDTTTVHVVGPREVRIVGTLRDRRDREAFLVATPAGDDVPGLNAYASQADFVLRVQRFFKDTPERAELLALVGNVTDEAVRVAADDGVSQIVNTRQGAKLGTTVKNPWLLVPKRSFAEIELAPVPFVLRLKGNGAGQASEIALFEADGGAWKVDAIRQIAGVFLAVTPRAWGLVA